MVFPLLARAVLVAGFIGDAKVSLPMMHELKLANTVVT